MTGDGIVSALRISQNIRFARTVWRKGEWCPRRKSITSYR